MLLIRKLELVSLSPICILTRSLLYIAIVPVQPKIQHEDDVALRDLRNGKAPSHSVIDAPYTCQSGSITQHEGTRPTGIQNPKA